MDESVATSPTTQSEADQAVMDDCIAEIQRLLEQMRQDQAEIDRLKADSKVIRAEIRTLKSEGLKLQAETRELVSRLQAVV